MVNPVFVVGVLFLFLAYAFSFTFFEVRPSVESRFKVGVSVFFAGYFRNYFSVVKPAPGAVPYG